MPMCRRLGAESRPLGGIVCHSQGPLNRAFSPEFRLDFWQRSRKKGRRNGPFSVFAPKLLLCTYFFFLVAFFFAGAFFITFSLLKGVNGNYHMLRVSPFVGPSIVVKYFPVKLIF